MRLMHVLAATAAALTLGLSVANAETVPSGYADAHYTSIDTDSGDADAWGIKGAYAAPLGDTVGIQLDAGWDTIDSDGSDDNDAISGTVHVFHRNDTALIGGAVGAVDSDDSTTWGAALEGDYYLANGTVGGRILYLTNDDADVDFWGAEAHYRHFITDDFTVEVTGGFGNAEADSGGDADVTWVGLEGEYQLAAAPVSLFAGAGWANVDSDGFDEDVTTLKVGVRYNFGGSLKDRDRTGASLKSLTDIGGAGSFVSAASSSYSPPEEILE